VARVEVSTRALSDLERLFDFVVEIDLVRALAQVASVRAAFAILADHPLLGRIAEDGRRELVLSRGRYGCIAKYRWLPAEDVVLILAVRHQREAGYMEDHNSDAALDRSSCYCAAAPGNVANPDKLAQ
jgi:plasmid stabilization system protein ParE